MDRIIAVITALYNTNRQDKIWQASRIIRKHVGGGHSPYFIDVMEVGNPIVVNPPTSADYNRQLQPYTPIITRGSLTVLSPEILAGMSYSATFDYLAKLTDNEITTIYQAEIPPRVDDERDFWLKLTANTFHENTFMALSQGYAELGYLPRAYAVRAINRFDNGDLAFGTQVRFYIYNTQDLLDSIEDDFVLPKAAADPTYSSNPHFTSGEIVSLALLIDESGNEDFFEHHKRLAMVERARKVEVILRRAAYHTNDPKIQEELWARNIR